MFALSSLVRRRSPSSRTRRLGLQLLEQRSLLTTFTVSTLADESDGNFADGDFSLREAVEQANLDAVGDTINFKAGLTGDIVLSGSGLIVSEDVTIAGPGASMIAISGNDAVRPFGLVNASDPVIASMSGLKIDFGNANGFAGGAVAIEANTSLSLSRMYFADNAAGQGGAVAVIGSTLSIEDTIFERNEALDGGAVAAFGGGSVSLNHVVMLSQAVAANGGAIWTSNCALSVRNSSIYDNFSGGRGGGIYHAGAAPDISNPTLRVINSTISANRSATFGGGVYVASGAAQFRNSTVVMNQADADNDGDEVGGGIVTDEAVPTSTMLFNTIVAGNYFRIPDAQHDLFGRNVEANSAHNLIGSATSSGGLTDGGTTHNIVGNGGTGTIPISTIIDSTLANNGGPTLTHSLVTGSLALDAGSNALALDHNGSALTTDQRGSGFARIVDGPDADAVATVDIGAYEARPRTLFVNTLVDESDGNLGPADFSLREALERANLNAGQDTINFSAGLTGTISTSAPLAISDSVVVNGPGANKLAINGDRNHRILEINDAGSVLVSGLAIHDGFASGETGGGILVAGSNLTLQQMHLYENGASGVGGGIAIVGSARPVVVSILNSTIDHNDSALGGGGIAQFGLESQILALRAINSTFSYNQVSGAGGAVYIETGDATFRNCTITANRIGPNASPNGGGLYVLGNTTLFNTIVAGNLRETGAGVPDDIAGEAVAGSSASNLIGDTSSAGGLTHGDNGNIVGNNGSGTIDIDTVLSTILTNNGGSTPTHKLLTGSPALDKGDNTQAVDQNGATLTADQRGRARFADRDGNGVATVDIGAVELGTFTLSLSGTTTYTENGEPLILASGATLSATENGTFNTGNLTVTNAVSPHADDRVIVRHQGVGSGQVSVSGANVSYGGVLIGTKTGGSGATPLVVTFNSDATPVAIQAVVRRIAFSSISNNPPTATRSIRFVVRDGAGAVTNTATKAVKVVRVNDVTVIGSFGSAVTYTEDTAAIGVTVSATVTDVDSFNFDTGELSARISTNAQSSDRLSIRNLGGVSTSNNEVIVSGEVIGTFSGGSGSTALVVTFNNLANAADVQAVLRALAFRNVSQNPSSTARTLSVFVSDGDGGTSATATKSINVVPKNDAPVLGGISGSVGYARDSAAILLAGSATVSDLDSDNFGGGRLRVWVDTSDPSNRLGIGGAFTVEGSNNVLLNGVIIGTRVSNGFGTSELVITFKTAATKAIVQQLVRAITFKTVNGAAGSRDVIFTVSDGDGGLSAEVSKTVNVT